MPATQTNSRRWFAHGLQSLSIDATWRHSIAFRVGVSFLLIAITILAMSLLTKTPVSPQSTDAVISMGLSWTILSGLVTFCGITSIFSLSSLTAVERQLVRASLASHRSEQDQDDNTSNSNLAPIIGNDRVVRGYNQILQASRRVNRPPVARAKSQLDDSAITHARAMRVLGTAWVITDEAGSVRYVSPTAKGLLHLPGLGAEAHTSHEVDSQPKRTSDDPTKWNGCISIFEALQVSDSDLIERFASRVRVIRSSIQVKLNEQEIHLDVTRSRLRGRDGDCEGLVWLIEDRTAQTQAIRNRDDFLMTATHELRTPLTNLRAHAEALAGEDAIEIEHQKQFCNVIVSESIRMGRLVDHLLSMGQIEAGSLVVENREVDLHSILTEVEDQILGQATEKHQTIQTEIADKLPTVLGDQDQLRSTINNLAGNAVKYTPDGGTITIRCHHPNVKINEDGSGTGQMVCIEVIDDGPGIPLEEQARVFEKFYRCEGSQTSERGNGLGLALAQEVARLHGGHLSLTSEPGEGCRFTMELPAAGQARSGVAR